MPDPDRVGVEPADGPDRVDLLLDDVREAPEALTRLLDAYALRGGALRGLPAGDLRRRHLVFSGLGSSRYASLLAAAWLRAQGVAAWAEFASSSLPTKPGTGVVFVAVSASGRTREVVEALERHRGASLTIGVTDAEDSPVATRADVWFPLYAGRERSGIATRTFRASVAVLALLAGHVLRGRHDVSSLRPSGRRLSRVIADSEAWTESAAGRLDGAQSIDVIGDAADRGLVEQAALMLREGPRLSASAHETRDWTHTAVYLALPGHRAILYPGSPGDAEVIATIRRRGGDLVSIPTARPFPDPIERALVDSVFAELLTVNLWRRVRASDKSP